MRGDGGRTPGGPESELLMAVYEQCEVVVGCSAMKGRAASRYSPVASGVARDEMLEQRVQIGRSILSLGPVVRYDSNRVIENSTNDTIGIVSHEGTDAAEECATAMASRWHGLRRGDASIGMPNEANLELTQGTFS